MSLEVIMMSWLSRGSSPVDWCENNYSVTPHIAEFVNTISNVLFLVIPVTTCRLWNSYASHVTKTIHVIWVFFFVVGLSSAYFHATLSLFGQLLDELSILWVMMCSYALFTPLHFRPKILRYRPTVFKTVLTVISVVITASAFVQPAINAYALFLVAVPAVVMLWAEVRGTTERHVHRVGVATLVSIGLAISAWVCDRFLCSIWQWMQLAILHGLWHVLIFFSAYTMQVLFCYFHACRDFPESIPAMRFWPSRKWGLPYVQCNKPQHAKAP